MALCSVSVVEDRDLSGILDADVYAGDTVAMFDNPTGFFAWDLMDAFPNYEVVLTVRNVSLILQ
jgi:ferredoxin-NADP reductase